MLHSGLCGTYETVKLHPTTMPARVGGPLSHCVDSALAGESDARDLLDLVEIGIANPDALWRSTIELQGREPAYVRAFCRAVQKRLEANSVDPSQRTTPKLRDDTRGSRAKAPT